MMSTLSKRFGVAGRAATVALGGVLVLGSAAMVTGDSGHAAAASPRLAGTWRVQVTSKDCTSGVPLLTFPAMLTFARGGTLTGTTAARLFQAGQRSPDHGVWTATGRGTYRALSEAFILFDSPAVPPAPGLVRGVQRITQDIEMTDADDFTSEAAVKFFDVGGNVALELCATAAGQRMK